MIDVFKAGDTVALNESFWRAFGSLYDDWRGPLLVKAVELGRYDLRQEGRDEGDTLALVPGHHLTLIRRVDEAREWAEAGAPAPTR